MIDDPGHFIDYPIYAILYAVIGSNKQFTPRWQSSIYNGELRIA
jgi:hypothetical protein